MKKADTQNRASEIRDVLEQEILTAERLAGERLDEQAMARRFGVSRTPVREALQQLTATGLVELQPHRGAFVRKVSFDELIQMFEVMAELEAMAGRLAARRRDRAALAALTEALEACERSAASGDPDGYYHENSLFHATIYRICGNDFLNREAGRLHQRLKAFRRLQLRVPKRLDQSLVEHRMIVAAIGSGDSAAAERLLRDHVTIQGERFADFVSMLQGVRAAE